MCSKQQDIYNVILEGGGVKKSNWTQSEKLLANNVGIENGVITRTILASAI